MTTYGLALANPRPAPKNRPFRARTALRCLLGGTFGLLVALWVQCGDAAPPEGANPAYGDFFRSLMLPPLSPGGNPRSCCDLTDCTVLNDPSSSQLPKWRYAPKGEPHQYEIIDAAGNIRPVRDEAILQRRENPTGRAVGCYPASGLGVYCFVRADEG